jgi:hypothetical protein
VSARVIFADPEPSGLAVMLGGLLEQNLARDPTRERLLHPSLVSIVARDAAVAVTLYLRPGRVLARDGVDPRALLRIAADSGRLMAMTAVPLRMGMPDVLTPQGRAIVRDIVARRITIRGMLEHPLHLVRLTSLLSVR